MPATMAADGAEQPVPWWIQACRPAQPAAANARQTPLLAGVLLTRIDGPDPSRNCTNWLPGPDRYSYPSSGPDGQRAWVTFCG